MRIQAWFVAVSLAVLPLVSSYGQASSAGSANLSAPALEVVKLVGAGTGESVVLAYIQNVQTPFNLSAADLVYFKDVGVAEAIVTAMLNRDTALRAQAPEPAPAAATTVAAAENQATVASNPPEEVTYFYNDLSPYGTWLDLPDYGWCWQPSVALMDQGWQPYCNKGHWINSEAGWCWASDYSWGWAPFHYGRWQRHSKAGWVWFPDKVWGPAWVTWRSGADSCGWAPLPPHAQFDARLGWRFNGRSVSSGFGFGLPAESYTFVGLRHFCDSDLVPGRLPPPQVAAIYNSTMIMNNYGFANNIYVNHGIPVEKVEFAIGGSLPPIQFQEPPRGWRPGQPIGPDGGGPILYRPQPLPPPGPLGPITATKSPLATSRDTSSSAVTGPPRCWNRFVTDCSAIMLRVPATPRWDPAAPPAWRADKWPPRTPQPPHPPPTGAASTLGTQGRPPRVGRELRP